MTAADDLAAELRRLCFDVQNPHRFQEAKRDLAARIARLALPSPCASCPAASLRHSLDAARRAGRAERDRAESAERLLAGAVRRPRRSPAQRNARQPDLWAENMVESKHGANDMSTQRRIEKLEHRTAATTLQWRRVICYSEAEANAARATAKPGEGLIIRLIVKPSGDHGRD